MLRSQIRVTQRSIWIIIMIIFWMLFNTISGGRRQLTSSIIIMERSWELFLISLNTLLQLTISNILSGVWFSNIHKLFRFQSKFSNSRVRSKISILCILLIIWVWGTVIMWSGDVEWGQWIKTSPDMTGSTMTLSSVRREWIFLQRWHSHS